MDVLEKLAKFTNAYHLALSALLAEQQDAFPFHSERTYHALIYQASDGFLTVYSPSPVSDDPHGAIGGKLPEFDLNTICQLLSARHIHVRVPSLNEPYFRKPPEELSDGSLQKVGLLYGGFVNQQFAADLHRLYLSGHPEIAAPAILITPYFRLDQGIVREITPCRWKLWSPVMEIPTVGLQRFFLWTHADIWFRPECLSLDPSQAEIVARNDLLSLQVLASASGALPVAIANSDAPTTAADRLEFSCDEFQQVLNDSGGDEHTIHRWLNQSSHHLFLDPDPSRVWSKVRFGDRESDFVIRRTDGTYNLIEIERANLRIFTRSKAEPTAEFNHACQQIKDWQRYIRDNALTVRNELQLDGIDQPAGTVIMGRSADIDSRNAAVRWRDLRNADRFSAFTYDEVCERVRGLASSLRGMMTNI